MLKGKIILVTGSARGIGAATAELLVQSGARLVVTSRTLPEIETTIAQIRSRTPSAELLGMRSDVSDEASVQTLFSAIEKEWGPVEILVNNAAVGFATDLLSMSVASWDEIQNINVRGTFLCSREMMRRLRGTGKKGAIVNMSSLGGLRGTEKFKGLTPYVASKFAVVGLTEALAAEGREFGVRVNCVAPGAVDTEMLRKAAPHLKTDTKPADVAKVIRYLCDDSESGSVSGTVIEIFSNG